MVEKPKTKAELEKALLRANNTIAKLRKQLERANIALTKYEEAAPPSVRKLRIDPKTLNPIGEVVTIMAGPLDDPAQPCMPWDDALPNGFAEESK